MKVFLLFYAIVQATVVASVVDNILEEVVLGLEDGSVSLNFRRVATVHFLGELYNYRIVGSTVIFSVRMFAKL